MNSFFKCASGGNTVVVWPTITGESGFYDTVTVVGGDESTATTLTRLTAYEAAAVVMTELGAPLATTLMTEHEAVASVEGMITRWRTEFDAEVREPVR